jgi:hypothetical protein
VQELRVAKRKISESDASHFTASMQTERPQLVNVSAFSMKTGGCALPMLEENSSFRQGLWIEDLRIPPGQECSNGSLILLAVVLWRTFCNATRSETDPLP